MHQKKVAAIGVRARSWITFHGMAINHTSQLEGFDLIIPCGLADAGVTCLEDLLQASIQEEELEANFCLQFATVFKRELAYVEQQQIWDVVRVG